MRPELIKICGLSTAETIDATIDGGATHMGMIFFSKSPRHLELEQAQSLSRHAGNRIQKVAVTVDAGDTYLEQIIESVNPDWLQFHGSETPDKVAKCKDRFGLPVIKSFAICTRSDLDKAKPYQGIADHFLFDAKAPSGIEIPGGNGIAFDWEIVDHWPETVPYILSGGLNSQNITDALRRSGAFGIDVSSGVESSPGIKDIEKIRNFLRTVLKEEECVE